ncbi:uncharacterized protein LOC124897962 [Capsicum annuum]|uniref:uncharacterized protein LOC124897962 n=1 Tax=Capsicum annuum TaxID=4072 RepID=UPI001FB11B1B|nr:uncharacterized protein LOC124897962 [Capsicum annuum]
MSLEKYIRKVSKISSTSQNQSRRDEDVDQIEMPSHSSQRQKYNVNDLKDDPAERPPILSYPPDIRESIHQGGGNTFSMKGFINCHRKDSFATHIGPPNNIHNQSKRKCEDLMREEQSIEAALQVRREKCDDIKPYVLEKAPKNNKMISHDIQKDIVTACKIETIKVIIKDLDGDYFALLVDESRDISRKEQMAFCLRYVDKREFVMEAFIGLVHVKNTSALSLKKAIVDESQMILMCHYKKKEQDIANAMILVKVSKRRLQALRDNEWDPILKKNLQELNDRFNEVKSDLLNGAACLNPIDTFSSFDLQKILVMAKLYPDDFDKFNMRVLENQLVNYIIDVRDIDKRFSNLGGLGELSRKLVETKKHLTYPLVFLLVKFALLLPVATTSVERAFFTMKYIKNDLRNRMDDEFLDGCIVPYVEKKGI